MKSTDKYMTTTVSCVRSHDNEWYGKTEKGLEHTEEGWSQFVLGCDMKQRAEDGEWAVSIRISKTENSQEAKQTQVCKEKEFTDYPRSARKSQYTTCKDQTGKQRLTPSAKQAGWLSHHRHLLPSLTKKSPSPYPTRWGQRATSELPSDLLRMLWHVKTRAGGGGREVNK